MYKYILLLVFGLNLRIANAQSIKPEIKDSLILMEQRLTSLGEYMVRDFDENVRITCGKNFIIHLSRALRLENSYFYPFDSLKNVMIKYAPDQLFRVITWNVATNDEHFRYFGVIQMNPVEVKKRKDAMLFKPYYPLIDRSDSLGLFLFKQTDANHWFGATYYDIVKTSNKKTDYYTVFGWDGYKNKSNRKVVDVITFENGSPVFGSPIFDLKQKRVFYRMVWEFNNNASMVVRYVPAEKAIVYENIVPDKPANAGNFETYLPDGTFDFLLWKNGKWEKQPDMYRNK